MPRPVHSVFKVLTRLCPLIVAFQKFTHKAHTHLLESLLERLALVALQPSARQRSVLRLSVTPREVRGWDLCSVRVLECGKLLESKRPYAPCTVRSRTSRPVSSSRLILGTWVYLGLTLHFHSCRVLYENVLVSQRVSRQQSNP